MCPAQFMKKQSPFSSPLNPGWPDGCSGHWMVAELTFCQFWSYTLRGLVTCTLFLLAVSQHVRYLITPWPSCHDEAHLGYQRGTNTPQMCREISRDFQPSSVNHDKWTAFAQHHVRRNHSAEPTQPRDEWEITNYWYLKSPSLGMPYYTAVKPEILS